MTFERFDRVHAWFLGLALLMLPGAARASWPTDPLVNVPLCTAPHDQSVQNSTVTDGAGGAIVLWLDQRSGTKIDIYGQHVLASGVVDSLWPSDGLALCTAARNRFEISIVSDGLSGAIFTWTDQRGTSYDIYAQHVLVTGVADPTWPADGRALCTAQYDQTYPKIVGDGSGGAIVAWQSVTSDPSGAQDIYAQHVLAGGAVDPAWPANGRALCVAAHDQANPRLVSDGSGGAIVAWEDERNGANYDMYAQHVLGNGAVDAAWPANGRALCTATGSQLTASLVSDGVGGAIVAWEDRRIPADANIYAQRVLASGAVDPAWPVDGRALATAADNQIVPQSVDDCAGGAIITWYAFSGTGGAAYVQHLLASGAVDPGWPASGVVLTPAVGAQVAPKIIKAVCGAECGGAIVSWQDHRGGGFAVYAQHVFVSGTIDPVWPVDGAALSTGANYRSPPDLVADGTGGAIAAWHDKRNGTDYDVYVQRVTCNGQIGTCPVGVPQRTGPLVGNALHPGIPNPFTTDTRIEFSLAREAAVTLSVYDLAGREIARLIDHEHRSAGVHAVPFRPGPACMSGVLFCRLTAGNDVVIRKMLRLE